MFLDGIGGGIPYMHKWPFLLNTFFTTLGGGKHKRRSEFRSFQTCMENRERWKYSTNKGLYVTVFRDSVDPSMVSASASNRQSHKLPLGMN